VRETLMFVFVLYSTPYLNPSCIIRAAILEQSSAVLHCSKRGHSLLVSND